MFKRTITFTREMPEQSASTWKRDIAIIVVLHLALGMTYLKTVPRFYNDEALEASYGHSLAYTGTLRSEFMEGFGGMHIRYVQPRIILPLVCAPIYKVAGFSITTSRFGSLLVSVLAIVSLYAVMRRWFGEKQAFWIVVAVIFYPWFFEVSRRIRSEIYYIAFSMATLWSIVCYLDSKSRRTAVLAGILAGLAGLSHPTGFILDFAIACAVLIWLRTEKIWRLISWACLGFVLAILPYIIYVLWAIQDPSVSFFEQLQNDGGRRITLFAGEIRRWKDFFRWPKGIPLAIIMFASWLLAWYRSTSFDKTLATIIGLFSLILTFTSINGAARYLAALTPFLCALIVRMVSRIMACNGHYKLRFAVSAGIVFVYLSMCITAISLMFYRLHGADFDRVLDRIASVVGREGHVYGEKLLWMGNDRYRYGPFPVDYTVKPWQQTVDMVRKYHFEYAVRTAWSYGSSYGTDSPPATMPDFRPNYTVDQVCKRFGTKIDEFRDPYFGPFEIYKLNWDNNSDFENKLQNPNM
jgi:hypothetical protein